MPASFFVSMKLENSNNNKSQDEEEVGVKAFDLSRLQEEVIIVPHSSEWQDWFETESAALQEVFGNDALGIEHMGSSAVENLLSKPIVDILVGLKEFSISDEQIKGLELLGFEYFGQLHEGQERLFARKRGEQSFNISIVPYAGDEWVAKTAFRDYLRAHPDIVEAYSAIKNEAIAGGNDSLLQYHKHKDEFVTNTLATALSWHEAQGR
ncbi:GrpB family protein [bacterium]|nr:GrpB family protein [bacterium]